MGLGFRVVPLLGPIEPYRAEDPSARSALSVPGAVTRARPAGADCSSDRAAGEEGALPRRPGRRKN